MSGPCAFCSSLLLLSTEQAGRGDEREGVGGALCNPVQKKALKVVSLELLQGQTILWSILPAPLSSF